MAPDPPITQASNDSRLRTLAVDRGDRPRSKRLFVRKSGRFVPLSVDEIRFVKASDDYTEAHTATDVYLLNLTMKRLTLDLDPERFVRVHRSFIVNLDHVEVIEPFGDRRLTIELRGGTRILASRAGSTRLRRLLS